MRTDPAAHFESPFATEPVGVPSVPPRSPRLDRLLAESPFVGELTDGFSAPVHELDEPITSEFEHCEGELALPDLQSEWFDDEAWSGSAEQIQFRDRVLAAHIARSRAARGSSQRDREPQELQRIPGTDIKTLPDTAAAAGRLLAAANADLALAQQAGDADALQTIRLTVSSGYRGSDLQRSLWQRYFCARGGYYDRTQAARDKLAQGPHSEQAVAYMLNPKRAGGFGLGGRIAAPGYSNHQGGIAIDFLQQRHKGHGISNSSDEASRARWRSSWFHSWLKANAARHGFQPLATEEWHWEYRKGSGDAVDAIDAQVAEHLGGKLWAFNASTLGLKVAVFCPKAAVARSEVDLLLFAHGLLGGCARPRRIPAGFVTDPPFELGRIVDVSGRPLVLAIPLLDWARPGGEAAFGAGGERWHALAKPSHLNALLQEVLAELGRVQSAAPPSLRELIIAGHSRAYDFLEPLAQSRSDPQMQQGALARLSRVWAFDSTYAGKVERWLDWLKHDARLAVAMFYRPGSKTAALGDRFYERRTDRLAVTRVSEGHCEVPATRLAELLKPQAANDPEALTADDEDGYSGEAETIDQTESDSALESWADESEDVAFSEERAVDLSSILRLDEGVAIKAADEDEDPQPGTM